MTPHLRERIRAIAEADWEEGTDAAGRVYSLARIRYCPATWDGRERTYLLSRRLREPRGQGHLVQGMRYEYDAYVTNLPGSAYEPFRPACAGHADRFCTERCSLEAFVKEAKLGLHDDRLPCAEATANRAYLQYVQTAYNLGIYFKRHAAPRPVNRWTLDTVRARWWVVCGSLRRRAGRRGLSLARWWPYPTVFRRVAEVCFGWACGPP